MNAPTPVLSAFTDNWYSGQLAAAQKPSLYKESLSGSGDTLRFTWLGSFHPPVTIRVERVRSRAPRLVAKQLSGAGGYAPGTISKTVDRALTPPEATALRATLADTRLFAGPPRDCSLGYDGAEWVFERVEGRDYRFISRWSPDRGGARDLGLALIGLTGWAVKDVY